MLETIQSIFPYGANGIALGLNISLVALALALVWRTAGMIDFGLGASYLVSAYAVLTLHKHLGFPLPLAMLGAVGLASACSLATYFGLYRYFISKRAPLFILVLVALATFIAVENLFATIYSAQKFYIIDDVLPGVKVLGTRLNAAQLSKALAALICLGSLAAFCNCARAGAAILAVADNPTLAQGVGVNVDRTYAWIYGIAGATVGIAAIPDVAEAGVDPYIGFNPIFLALASLIVGGIQDFRSPVLGAILLGLAFHLAVWVFSSQWQEVVAYGLVIAILFARPQGLFGGFRTFRGRA